jgi:hypothetical protein
MKRGNMRLDAGKHWIGLGIKFRQLVMKEIDNHGHKNQDQEKHGDISDSHLLINLLINFHFIEMGI